MNFNPDKIKIFNADTRFSKNIDKQKRYLEKIHKYKNALAPEEGDFTELYSDKEIQHDKELVRKLKLKFVELNNDQPNHTDSIERMKRVSDIYEAVIIQQADRNNWFGKNVSVYYTSEYDDYVNGVDGVAEFFDPNGESKAHVAMSFDVVFSKHSERVIEKLEKTKKLIQEGDLTSIKYFEDDNGDKKSLKAPRIILGSRLVSAEKLIDLWGGSSKNKNKQLAEHSIQIKLLLETYLQAYHFYNYAKSIGKNDISYSYGVITNKISDILNNEKTELLQKHFNDLSEDIVFETIRDYCDDVQI